MHYLNIVIIKKTSNIEDAVQKAMGGTEEEGGFYDWYEIGGRWTGYFDGYDPTKDPRNLEKCSLCKGTGKREDEIGRTARSNDPAYTCNGCDGVGKSVRLSTRRHKGDIMPVWKLTQAHLDGVCRIVITSYGVFGGEDFQYRPWLSADQVYTCTQRDKPPIEWIVSNFGKRYLAVVVDNHC